MKSVRLAIWILVTLFRSGILPCRIDHWVKMVRALWLCGPSFAFLGQIAAARFPRHQALCDDKGSLSFAQLNLQSEALARFLRTEDGVAPGDRVAIVFSNHRGFVLSLLALTRLGADVLPMNPRLPEAVLTDLLERQDIDLVLHEAEVSDRISAKLVSRVWQHGLDAPGGLTKVKRAGQLIVLTSGSTGVSKGIVRRPTLSEVLPVTAGLLNDLPIEMNRPTILAIPFFHGYGIATLAMSLALGSSLLTGRQYDVSTLLARHVRSEPAMLITVPTLLWRWMQGSIDKPNLQAIITGSAPLNSRLCQDLLRRLGPVLYNLYGATETGLIALATPDMLKAAPGCVGLPLPGNEVVIAGDEVGRIQVRGPLVLGAGSDGWLDTGDLGRLDQNGYLHVCGRADGMIVSGGENVFLHELADALSDLPEIKDFAVVPVDDEEFGQRTEAAVVLWESASGFDEIKLKERLGQKLERFKLPRRIHLLDSIPRNELGKVRKKELENILAR
jgi:acyl-CoA synthetase (AMP-forming)/AMP-acid ligase II